MMKWAWRKDNADRMSEPRKGLMEYESLAAELKRLVMAVNTRTEVLGHLGLKICLRVTTELTWVPQHSMSVEIPTIYCEVDLPL